MEKTPNLKQSETSFKEKVLADLKTLRNCWCLKTMERGRHGTPDLLICLDGKFVAIELKKEGGRVMKIQELTLEKIMAAGGISFVASPSTWVQQFKLLQIRVL